jgi:PBP1b-binding outer membrane lipoprotein LpoB
MKKEKILLSFLFIALIFTSCSYHYHSQSGGLPPGQAKKVTGSKSAKAYAPGQQKKH